ncbi:MAG: protein-S-isoprenylcysteine O-methyltransferase [Pseudomonadota bacterium]|nr:protein-S-isoprenylcysteine O-methyltransferase [Pseudomonadota bacterium]
MPPAIDAVPLASPLLEPAHAGELVFVLGLLAYLGVRVVYLRRRAGVQPIVRKSPLRQRQLVLLAVVGQIAAPLVRVFTPWLDAANCPASATTGWLLALGTAVMLASVALFWAAHHALGRHWSGVLALHRTHELVTHGVYRHARHPMYAAFLLLAISQTLLLRNGLTAALALLALLAATALYLLRAREEEAMLLAHFGPRYRAYQRRTGALLPRLWRRAA